MKPVSFLYWRIPQVFFFFFIPSSLLRANQIKNLFADFLYRGIGNIGANDQIETAFRTDPETRTKTVIGSFMAKKSKPVLFTAEPAEADLLAVIRNQCLRRPCQIIGFFFQYLFPKMGQSPLFKIRHIRRKCGAWAVSPVIWKVF